MNLPNLITLLRILLIPIFILIFSDPSPDRAYWAAAIFLFASLTDWADGYIARKWSQVTLMGKLLDPIADKLLILSALILLVDFERVASWIAIVIIGRELAVTGLRAIAASLGHVIHVEEMGKYKTTVQVIAIVLLILPDPMVILNYEMPSHQMGTYTLWVAVFLAMASAVQYFYRFWTEWRGAVPL
ncbi:MAG: CDP-diacylglycerol--glycerol-3-phosphate 3-phosphatidyltransferase [Nitrospirae bacterium]|nr:CDP-diacylglycerol--glycerol-3-phosphate 3-phosphatidyltransferase [Nitrospirota bacterium]